MFLDYLYNMPNATGGIDNIAIQLVDEVPMVMPLLLLFVFFTVWLSGVSLQKARNGTADYAMWSVIASMSTLMITLILSMATGLLDILYLSIVIGVNLLCGYWLLVVKKNDSL